MNDLIVFFSRKDENYVSGSIQDLREGNTEKVANIIHDVNNGDLFELEMVVPYAKDYNDCIEEAKRDKQQGLRPALKALPQSIEQYETIYLGYPNYWGTMPMAVFTFLDSFDFSDKVIRPFCTHEGSGLGNSERDIKQLCSTAKVEKGLAIHGSRIEASKTEIEKWVTKK